MTDAFMDGEGDEYSLFLVTEYVQGDLRSMLNEGPRPSLVRIRRIMHQLLQAIAYLHHRGVIHRDLKPENVLVSKTDDVRICDLGMARRRDVQMTGYLATRYYRAPEFMLTWQSYGAAVDVWSLGCILAEMATGTLLFPGADHVHHLKSIMQLVGSPPAPLLERICSPSTRKYMAMLPTHARADFQGLFAECLGWEGADLLDRMLAFDPTERITPVQALLHPFFTGLDTSPRHDQLMVGEGVLCEHWPAGGGETEESAGREASRCGSLDRLDTLADRSSNWTDKLKREIERVNERRRTRASMPSQWTGARNNI